MNDISNADISAALRNFVNEGVANRRLMDWLSKRRRDASETKAERIMAKASVDRSTAIAMMQELDEIGVADYYVGRRGAKTRLIWNYSCSSVGRVALALGDELESPSIDDDVDDESTEDADASLSAIDRAKRIVAREWGVNVNNIEIRVTV